MESNLFSLKIVNISCNWCIKESIKYTLFLLRRHSCAERKDQ